MKPRRYLYGEMFERLNVPGMGYIGALWCALNPKGVLVLMAHKNYFKKDKTTGRWQYEMPPDEPAIPRSQSAQRSLDLLQEYFVEGRPIILPVGEFETDGNLNADGTWTSSKFDHATGDYYEGRMVQFDRDTGYLLCDLDTRKTV